MDSEFFSFDDKSIINQLYFYGCPFFVLTDFQKNITVILIGAVMSSGATVAVLGERITGVDKAVVKLSVQIERLDSKQREIELAQARMLAAN